MRFPFEIGCGHQRDKEELVQPTSMTGRQPTGFWRGPLLVPMCN